MSPRTGTYLKTKQNRKKLNFTSEVTLCFRKRLPSRLLACTQNVMETSRNDGKLFLSSLTVMLGLRPPHGVPDGCGCDSLLVPTLVIPKGDTRLGACPRKVGS